MCVCVCVCVCECVCVCVCVCVIMCCINYYNHTSPPPRPRPEPVNHTLRYSHGPHNSPPRPTPQPPVSLAQVDTIRSLPAVKSFPNNIAQHWHVYICTAQHVGCTAPAPPTKPARACGARRKRWPPRAGARQGSC